MGAVVVLEEVAALVPLGGVIRNPLVRNYNFIFSFFHMALAKRIAFFLAINIGLMVSIGILIAVLESVFGIRITANLSDGYTSLAIYSAVYGFSSAFISLAISRMIAKWMYSIELVKGERLLDWDPKVQAVYATVDRLAKSHGITMPEVGVYDSAEPNAFATGPTKNRALVAVSQGLLDTMSQSEIEGVVGHEMAHVLNGDMVTMTLLQGVLNTIIIFVARILSNIIAGMIKSEGDTYWIETIVNFVLQIVLGFFAMIVLAAFSRYREYRADEDSAKMLGKASMIAALKKLQSLREALVGKVESDDRFAAMQISTYKASEWFSTHPALEKRISALETRYDLV